MKLAIIHKEKCKPDMCGRECEKCCPVNKKGGDEKAVVVEKGSKAIIDEGLCVGCGICVKRCPFGAIDVVNLPSVEEKDLVFRYGENSFALYGLPVPKQGAVLGLLGRNGIGKSTVVKILAGKENANFGKKDFSEGDIKKYFQGNELLRYFQELDGKKISYKPQNLSFLSIDLSVINLLKKRGSDDKIMELACCLGVEYLLDNKLNKLSGGELQKVAIIASALGDSDIYFFDEPLAFLDIAERLKVSDFIIKLGLGKTVVVVEHDLLILDYLTEYLNIFYGQQGVFGLVSGVKSSKYGVNSYLAGYLKEENLQIRKKSLNFNFTKNQSVVGKVIAKWDDFKINFDNFSLDVDAGEIKSNQVIGILGKNGTGKTSFVKALAGIIKVNNKKFDLGLKISYKSQYLFDESDESVSGIVRSERIGKKISSMFNLETIYLKKVGQLSGGELQRFSIARCLSKDADVYLIDEPSAYLDVEERISVAKNIKDLMIEKEKTAFVVDHDLLLISYLADNIMVFSGESGKFGKSGNVLGFEEGISKLLKELDITLRKDRESGRPRINNKGSVLDREQKEKGELVVF